MTVVFLYIAGVLAVGLLLYCVRGGRRSLWQPTVPQQDMSEKKPAVNTRDSSGFSQAYSAAQDKVAHGTRK